MNPRNALLAALAAQIGLAVLTWWPSEVDVVEPKPLVESANAVTALTVVGKGPEKVPVELVSEEGRWKVASASGYPADPEKVATVLEALAGVQLRAPIATTAASHEALGVTDGGFERKVTLTTAAGATTVLVGPSASQAVHLRLAEGDAVWQVRGLSAWTLKDDAKGYLPTNHVSFEPSQVTSFQIANARGTLSLTRTSEGTEGAAATWQIDGATPTPIDAAAVTPLLEKAAKVRLGDVVGTVVETGHGLLADAAVPPTRVTWTAVDGEQTLAGGYVIGAELDGKYFVKSDDSPFVIRTPTYRTKDLVDLDPSTVGAPAP